MKLHARTPRQIAQSYWDAEAERDLDLMMSHYCDDAVLETPTGVLQGAGNIRTFYEPMFSEFPMLKVEIVRDITNGSWAAFEYDAVLTREDGSRLALQGCNIIKFRDDKFKYLRGYFDTAGLFPK